MHPKNLLTVLAAAGAMTLSAANNITPIEVNRAPRIDGKLDDSCWQQAPVATDFLLFGSKTRETATRKTEAKIIYTNKAMVLGFKCHIPDDRFPAKDNPQVRPFLMDWRKPNLIRSDSFRISSWATPAITTSRKSLSESRVLMLSFWNRTPTLCSSSS